MGTKRLLEKFRKKNAQKKLKWSCGKNWRQPLEAVSSLKALKCRRELWAMKGRYYDAFSARLHCLLPEGVIFLRLLFQYNARAASTAVSGPWKGNKKSPAEAVEAAGEPWRKPRPRNATRTSRLSFEYIVKVSWLLLSRSFQDFSLSLGGCGLRHKTWIFFHLQANVIMAWFRTPSATLRNCIYVD